MKVVRPAASKRAQRTCTGGANSSVAVTSAPVPVSPRSGLFFCASSLPVIFSTPATRPTICAACFAAEPVHDSRHEHGRQGERSSSSTLAFHVKDSGVLQHMSSAPCRTASSATSAIDTLCSDV